ncbi:hypothetical protein POM88_042599 [Heracleum sosnowskyi]|uniref:Protein kinase domain-containing protein n=1 Tax=Heracleum sosnowskyi TaxID=360622 RepID=A0AAD8MCC6_9APIA|nr:hypothetical protein POM88_042599 [Heracleum sosnowskyi]
MGVLKALEYIHGRENLVHGNINLNYVFLVKDCKVKLQSPMRKNCVIEEQKTDIRMVGELALYLFSSNMKKKDFLSGLAVRNRFNVSVLMPHDGAAKEAYPPLSSPLSSYASEFGS